MKQEQFNFLITPIKESEPYLPKEGEGWYQVALYHYPTKHNIDTGTHSFVESRFYAKSLVSAKQKASKWAKQQMSEFSKRFPIQNTWEEVKSRSYGNYGKYWKKTGKYFTCNPELYLVPNNIATKNT